MTLPTPQPTLDTAPSPGMVTAQEFTEIDQILRMAHRYGAIPRNHPQYNLYRHSYWVLLALFYRELDWPLAQIESQLQKGTL